MSSTTVWLSDVSSNKLQQSYFRNFVDVSGHIIVRNNEDIKLFDQNNNYTTFSVNSNEFKVFQSQNTSVDISTNKLVHIHDLTTNVQAKIDEYDYTLQYVDTSTNVMEINADMSMNHNLKVQGDVSLNSKLFVEDDASMNSKLFVGGDVSFNNNLYVNNSITANNHILPGNSNVDLGTQENPFRSLYIQASSLHIGDTDPGADNTAISLDNSGIVVTTNDVIFDVITFHRDSASTGIGKRSDSTLANLDVSGSFLTSGRADIYGDVSFNSKLYVNDDVSLNNRLSVQNDVSFNNKLYVQNDVSFNDKLYVKNKIGINESDPKVSFDISATDAIRIPVGNSLQRPNINGSGGRAGYMRFNTDTNRYEFSNQQNWVPLDNKALQDEDKDTSIQVENSPGVDNDEIRFFTAGSEQMRIKSNGDISMNHKLFIDNDVSMNSKLFVNDDVSFNSKLFVNDDVSFNSQMFVGDHAIFDRDVSIKGNLSVFHNKSESVITTTVNNYEIIITEDISLNGELLVNGDTSMNGLLYVTGDVSFNSELHVGNETTIDSTLKVIGDVSMNSKLFVFDDVSFNRTLHVGDVTTLDSMLHVLGDTSLNSKLFVEDDVSMNSKLFVGNDVSLNSNVYIGNNISINANLSIVGEMVQF